MYQALEPPPTHTHTHFCCTWTCLLFCHSVKMNCRSGHVTDSLVEKLRWPAGCWSMTPVILLPMWRLEMTIYCCCSYNYFPLLIASPFPLFSSVFLSFILLGFLLSRSNTFVALRINQRQQWIIIYVSNAHVECLMFSTHPQLKWMSCMRVFSCSVLLFGFSIINTKVMNFSVL